MHNIKTTTLLDRVRQLLPEPIWLDNADKEAAPPILQFQSSDTRLTASDHRKLTSVSTGTVSRRKAKALQGDTKQVLEGWLGKTDNTFVTTPTNIYTEQTPSPRR